MVNHRARMGDRDMSRTVWRITAVAVASGFPLLAVALEALTDWRLSWQCVSIYTGGVIVSLLAAFDVPWFKRNGNGEK